MENTETEKKKKKKQDKEMDMDKFEKQGGGAIDGYATILTSFASSAWLSMTSSLIRPEKLCL